MRMRQSCSRMRTTTRFADHLAAAAMLQDVRARSRDAAEDGDVPSVFDAPDGEPECIFVNPFACGVSPLQWRELQVGLVLSGCGQQGASSVSSAPAEVPALN